jgi:hypothetical protein
MNQTTNSRKNDAADLHSLSRRGLRDLSLFLLISTAFFCLRGIDLLAPLGESARMILGSAPPTGLMTLAVGGYTLSALVLIVGRTVTGDRPRMTWLHLFFRTVFYPFFLFANALEGHFMSVFIAGLMLFALEQLNIWSHAQRNLPRKEIFGPS